MGLIETPVYLTSTMAVGRVYDGAVEVACAADPAVGVDDVVIPVVGECDDSWLNDARTVQVEAADAGRAVAAAAGGPVAQGCVGLGPEWWRSAGRAASAHRAGLWPRWRRRSVSSCSRTSARPPSSASAAAGVSGDRRRARRAAAGRELRRRRRHGRPARDAQLERVARRAGLGLARTGSVAHHGSGEIFLAFSTACRERDDEPPPAASADRRRPALDHLFAAVVEATEEAVLNALWAAVETTGREGRVVRALPHEPAWSSCAEHRRLS